jgi:hypothetical protein
VANLTTTAADKLLDHLLLTTAWTPTSPLKLALVTVLGSASAAGTEVTGGSYARQSTGAFSAAAAESAGNSSTITFANMPACTVVGVELWDSAGTPVRILWGALSASRTYTAGDSAFFTAAELLVALG